MAGTLGVAAIVAWLIALSYVLHELRGDVKRQEWAAAISNANENLDQIEPNVGVIQFLKSGYSITLDTVEYTPTGLHLAGTVGNPKAISLSGLTLKIAAYRPAYQVHSDTSDALDLYFRRAQAEGQASVGDLPAGGVARFALTIASLVQAKSDSVDLSVELAGARYSYIR